VLEFSNLLYWVSRHGTLLLFWWSTRHHIVRRERHA
jgi:hypothetical protein